ncbi:MAG: TetR/AcrR family transcriptional regulator [Chloroflexi bacterium]|nr:TetR/AcrR family transcriptional regulator [Chloroflexota bacterium]
MSQNSPSTDLRVRRTRKLLRDALVALIAERGFEALKVADIADRAMINRATFYRHYRDKHDLLAHCMDDAFEELKARMRPPESDGGALDHGAPLANSEAMLAHVAENADFYRVMLSEDGAGTFVSRLRTYLRESSAERWQVVATYAAADPLMPPDLILHFVASAYIGAIVWWVAHDCPGSAAQMASHLFTLTMQGPYRAFGLQPPHESNYS